MTLRTIDILCPSRGRPQRFAEMAESAIDKAAQPDRVTILLLVDHDDPMLDAYRQLSGLPGVRLIVGDRKLGCPGLLNVLATEHSAGELLVAGSDDILFRTEGWDEAFDRAFDAVPDQILVAYTNDGRDRDKCEHFVVSRRWVEIVGFFMWPGFEHFSGDGYVEDVAKRVGRLTFLRDVVTEHMHFKYKKSARDDTYAAKRQADAEGRSMSDRDLARMAQTEADRVAIAARLREAMGAPSGGRRQAIAQQTPGADTAPAEARPAA